MAKIQKLYKREGKDKKTLVYPATITQAVKDGETGQNLHEYMNDIKPKFKFDATQTDSQLGTVGTIQLSQDGGKTWNPISPEFLNNLRIQGYVATTSALPANKPVGTIYGVGPTYAASDTSKTNPIYRLYAYNGSSWVDNGQFTSIAAGIVQETGNSETEVMSQKATTEKLTELASKNESNSLESLSLDDTIHATKAWSYYNKLSLESANANWRASGYIALPDSAKAGFSIFNVRCHTGSAFYPAYLLDENLKYIKYLGTGSEGDTTISELVVTASEIPSNAKYVIFNGQNKNQSYLF